ncbi:response regulator transcription factor [Eubacterium sp.]|uniref:response regulator n=1 Tax=Eubacterium sp. TaxID=142586 RepID=UPI0025E118D0|nr:response regulator transcription factor [Eubacterium sp.]MCR5629120.1 response regulator transcription factor [Eubacterium sp.]
MEIRILLVDDEPLLIESLEIILNNEDGFKVVGLKNNGKEALDFIRSEEVDVMLVDLNMPVMGGIELIEEVKKINDNIKIVVLTTFYDESNITSALKNGANGYILKDSGKSAIINAITQAVSGNGVLDNKVMEKLTGLLKNNSETDKNESISVDKTKEGNNHIGSNESEDVNEIIKDFTPRELEIAKLIADGCTNSQIASILFISEGTVKNYVSNIYDKANIHDRTQLVIFLREKIR